MDLKLEGFSNEELMKAIIENSLIMFIETHRINLSEEDKIDIIDSIVSHKNGEIIDMIFERVHDELEKRELFDK